MKYGLVVISAPQFMLQALWFCAMHPECKFDVYINLADISEDAAEKLIRQCRMVDCFHHVYMSDGFMGKPLAQKAMLLMKMIGYFCVGRREELTSRLINSEVDGAKYDTVVVDNEYGVIGGAFIDHSDREYDVYIMQDGFADMMNRVSFPKAGITEAVYWLMAALGYCNPAYYYKLKKTKYCSKITTLGSFLKYKQFKEILNMETGCSNPLYLDYVSRVYPLDGLWEDTADVLLLTTHFHDIQVDNPVDKLRDWMYKEYKGKKIGLKKHPRDTDSYNWDEFEMQEIDSSIPAELLLGFYKNKTVISANISTVLAEVIEAGIDYKVIYYNCINNSVYKNSFHYLVKELNIPDERVVCID